MGKGRKERKVYFSEEAIEWLARYLATRHDDHPAVFITTGWLPKRLQAHGTWKRFNRYGQMAGLSKRVEPGDDKPFDVPVSVLYREGNN